MMMALLLCGGFQMEHEELYEILSDHFAFACEEDSWEKGQDLDTWETEQMQEYFDKYIGS